MLCETHSQTQYYNVLQSQSQCFRQQVCNVPPFPERVRCLEPLFQRDTLNPFHNDAVADTFYRFKREDGNNHRVLHLTENIVLFLKKCLINPNRSLD